MNVLVELPAHVLTVSALLVNLVGAHQGEEGLATAGRVLFAIAVILQWVRLLRPLQLTESFGAAILMMVRMGNDIFKFLALYSVWAIAFATGMYALFKDPSGQANQELLHGALFPCSDWDKGAQP